MERIEYYQRTGIVRNREEDKRVTGLFGRLKYAGFFGVLILGSTSALIFTASEDGGSLNPDISLLQDLAAELL